MDKAKIMDAAMTVCRSCNNGYARAYAETLGRIIDAGADDEAIRAQVLYVLSNLSHWRGDIARQTKLTFKEAIA
jgi:hypothetical protein